MFYGALQLVRDSVVAAAVVRVVTNPNHDDVNPGPYYQLISKSTLDCKTTAERRRLKSTSIGCTHVGQSLPQHGLAPCHQQDRWRAGELDEQDFGDRSCRCSGTWISMLETASAHQR